MVAVASRGGDALLRVLICDDHTLVRAGLRLLGEGRRPGLRALLEQARWDFSQPLSAEDVKDLCRTRLAAYKQPGRILFL